MSTLNRIRHTLQNPFLLVSLLFSAAFIVGVYIDPTSTKYERTMSVAIVLTLNLLYPAALISRRIWIRRQVLQPVAPYIWDFVVAAFWSYLAGSIFAYMIGPNAVYLALAIFAVLLTYRVFKRDSRKV